MVTVRGSFILLGLCPNGTFHSNLFSEVTYLCCSLQAYRAGTEYQVKSVSPPQREISNLSQNYLKLETIRTPKSRKGYYLIRAEMGTTWNRSERRMAGVTPLEYATHDLRILETTQLHGGGEAPPPPRTMASGPS